MARAAYSGMRSSLLAIVLQASLAAPAHLGAQSDVAFPSEVYARRRASLTRSVGNGDAIIVVPGRYLVGNHDLPKQDPHFWYLTGVESAYAILVLAPNQREILFLPDSFEFAGAQYPMLDSGFKRATWNRAPHRLAPGAHAAAATGIREVYPLREFAERLVAIVGERKTVFLPMPNIPLHAPKGMAAPLTLEQQFVRSVAGLLPGVVLEDVGAIIHARRLTKDTFEIRALRRAAHISARSMRTLMQRVRPGMNDLEAAGILEADWKRQGSHRASFAPIIGSGPNSMTFFTVMGERYNAVNRVMRAGELLFVDYGAAEYMTYASDICRTLPVSGRFTPLQRKYYDIVLEAQEAAIATVRPGVRMLDVIKAAAEVFRKHGLEKYEDITVMGADRVWGVMPSPGRENLSAAAPRRAADIEALMTRRR